MRQKLGPVALEGLWRAESSRGHRFWLYDLEPPKRRGEMVFGGVPYQNGDGGTPKTSS